MSIFSLLREHTQVAMAVATKIRLDAAPKLDGLPRRGHGEASLVVPG